MRPPGYEPGELPTAPLRDVFIFAFAKVVFFFGLTKYSYNYFPQMSFFDMFFDIFCLNYLLK